MVTPVVMNKTMFLETEKCKVYDPFCSSGAAIHMQYHNVVPQVVEVTREVPINHEVAREVIPCSMIVPTI